MPTTYSPKGTSIRPYELTAEQHAAIGRLVRACAEIEDIINLRLYDLADIIEGVGMVFLGRTSVVKRLELLRLLSQGRGSDAYDLYKQAFDNTDYRDLVSMRNTVAHGYLLG